MPNIKAIDGMSPQEISFEINRGGKFMRHRYCYSMPVLTMMQSTAIYFVRADESRLKRGLHWSFLTLFCGGWGIPWGPIRSVQSIWIRLNGGEDLTPLVARAMFLTNLDWVVVGSGDS